MFDQIEHYEEENEDNLIDAHGWLGTTLHRLERYDEAVDVWCRAAHSYKQSAELQSPGTDVKVSKYAVFFQTLIEYQQAEAAYRNALHTAGSQSDPDHPKELVALKAARSDYTEQRMKRRLIVQIALPAHLNFNQNTRKLGISGDI